MTDLCFNIAEMRQLLKDYVVEFIVDSAFQPDIINLNYVTGWKVTTTYYDVSLLVCSRATPRML